MDHTPGGGVRNAHDTYYSGLFATVDEVDMDWDVPGAATGVENWRRVPYSGVVDQALITADNAATIALGTWISGDTGSSIGILGTGAEARDDTRADQRIDAMQHLFDNVALQVIPDESGGIAISSVQSFDEAIYGTCGGNARLIGSGDDQTGEIEGTITFNNYCDAGITLNGIADIFMHIDLGSEDIYHYLITFTDLTARQEGYSSTIDGRIGADYTVYPYLTLLSYVVNDNLAGKSYWLKDLISEITEGFNYIEIAAVTGRYYDPDYGYVEYSIEQPIRIYDDDAWPTSGIMLFWGSADTKIRFTFLNEAEYLVEADTDGDGAYDDYSSGPQLWSEL
ncbi:MAG: hypothetical protein R3297_04735 [Desulfobulbales bacterium]|nr:hypothetical protein [Desulfobulbales bacterium]